jgi:hypothetical protein
MQIAARHQHPVPHFREVWSFCQRSICGHIPELDLPAFTSALYRSCKEKACAWGRYSDIGGPALGLGGVADPRQASAAAALKVNVRNWVVSGMAAFGADSARRKRPVPWVAVRHWPVLSYLESMRGGLGLNVGCRPTPLTCRVPSLHRSRYDIVSEPQVQHPCIPSYARGRMMDVTDLDHEELAEQATT